MRQLTDQFSRLLFCLGEVLVSLVFVIVISHDWTYYVYVAVFFGSSVGWLIGFSIIFVYRRRHIFQESPPPSPPTPVKTDPAFFRKKHDWLVQAFSVRRLKMLNWTAKGCVGLAIVLAVLGSVFKINLDEPFIPLLVAGVVLFFIDGEIEYLVKMLGRAAEKEEVHERRDGSEP